MHRPDAHPNDGGRASAAGKKQLPPDPTRADRSVEDVAFLAHELSNLLDGTLRWMNLAVRTLDQARGKGIDESLDQAQRQIQNAAEGMTRMNELVDAALRSATVSIGSALAGKGVTLGEAIRHAVEVVSPDARDLGVSIGVTTPAALENARCGPLYAALLNALRNSVESINDYAMSVGSVFPAGRIEIEATSEFGPDGSRWIAVYVKDNGIGPPRGSDAARVFDFGFTTKVSGSGVGLALAQSIARELRGSIQLLPRFDTGDPKRPGAVLRIAFPEQTENDREFGERE